MLQIVENGNVTESTFKFVPKASDHGRTITCRAENTEIQNAAIEDHWKLTVHCKNINTLFEL